MDFITTSSTDDFLIRVAHNLDYLLVTPEALVQMTRFGYDATRLQEGRLLLEQASAVYRTKQQLQRQQKLDTDRFRSEWKTARQRYKVHLAAAREAFGRDAEALLQPMPDGYSRWLGQARSFYAAILANPDYQSKLMGMTLSLEELQRCSQTLETIAASKTEQMSVRSSVRLTNQRRNQELTALRRWFGELMSVARIALREQPGLFAALKPVRPRPVEKVEKGVEGEK